MSIVSEGTFIPGLQTDDKGTPIGADSITYNGKQYTRESQTKVGREVIFDAAGTQPDDLITIVDTTEGRIRFVYKPERTWSTWLGSRSSAAK